MASIGDQSQAVPPECPSIVALEALIEEEMRNLSALTEPCIYKIPQKLRDLNPKAYTPSRVAIGPYHANAEHLQSMEPYKLRYLKSLMWRRSREGQSNLRRLIKAIEGAESEARECYSGIEELDSLNFKRMLLLDGAFIVEFLYRLYEPCSQDFPLQGNDKTIVAVCADLLLLENQLPFFILQDLFDCTFESHPVTFPAIAFAVLCGSTHVNLEDFLSIGQVKQRTTQEKVNHLLHLLWICCFDVSTNVSLDAQGENPGDTAQMPPGSLEQGKLRFLCSHLKIPSWWGEKEDQATPTHFRNPVSITELREAGVQFRAKKGKFAYIEFDEATGVLEMSRLNLDQNTEIFFRNVIAYEQYYLNVFHATNYMYLLGGLINTEKDVAIIVESQVVDCVIHSKEEAAKIFIDITKETVVEFVNMELRRKFRAYTMKPWNRWKVMLRRDYFGSPWAIISFIAAVVLLGLTAVQTIASVRSTKWD